MQAASPLEEGGFALFAVGVGQAGIGRTDGGTLLDPVKAHAFGAALGIDDVQRLALGSPDSDKQGYRRRS